MYKFAILFVLLLMSASCQPPAEVTEPPIDLEAEEAAIKEVLTKQAQAFSNRSIQGEEEVWAHEPYVYRGIPGEQVVGWDSLRQAYEEIFAEVAYPAFSAEFADHFIHIRGDLAWIIYRQVNTFADEEGAERTETSWGMRILEKKEGLWKLVLQTGGPFPEPEPEA